MPAVCQPMEVASTIPDPALKFS
nr:unnamed protein product [Callosobruchus analis]